MTEKQARAKMRELDRLIDKVEEYREAGLDNAPECTKIKKRIVKLEKEFQNNPAPIRPMFYYDVETGAYKG